MEKVKITECPRDAMQGYDVFVPTKEKIRYINKLLKVGFDTIDFGSFVSPKAIPQMRDTAQVIEKLELDGSISNLSAIVANERGARDASQFHQIDYFGYPFSISETFQRRNTNTSIEGSLHRIEAINEIAMKANKQLILYLSMGFGNPYGDPWNEEIVLDWTLKLNEKLGISILSLSDTVGIADGELVSKVLNFVMPQLPDNFEFGVHLHTTPETFHEKLEAAYNAGCRRFDGAIRGFGGCPMAEDDLVGNMPTERMIGWFKENGIELDIDYERLDEAIMESNNVFL